MVNTQKSRKWANIGPFCRVAANEAQQRETDLRICATHVKILWIPKFKNKEHQENIVEHKLRCAQIVQKGMRFSAIIIWQYFFQNF